MITTLKKFEVWSKETNNLISAYSLKLNGYRYELHSLTEVIMSGIEAERHYSKCLELNKLIVEQMDDLKLVEVKEEVGYGKN